MKYLGFAITGFGEMKLQPKLERALRRKDALKAYSPPMRNLRYFENDNGRKIMPPKTLEQLHAERDKRLTDAIELKIPDRVPVDIAFGYFPAKYTGIPCSTAYYDYDTWLAATKKTVLDFDPDGVFYSNGFSPGLAMEYIDPRSMKWPGHGVPAHHSHQAIEGEWMKSDDYDS